MKENNLIVKAYLEENIKLEACVKYLEELEAEKAEILKLANSKNPPSNILEIMKKNEEKYENLLKASEKLKEEVKKLSK